MKKKFNILSIDGGGIRGIIPAKVLAELETELLRIYPDKQFYEHFDLICGTSTGAILAIGISLGIPPGELVNFYKTYARIIFPKWYLKVLPRKVRVLVTSIYSNKQLRKILKKIFSEANGGEPPLLNDLKTNVCIPSFNGNMGEITVLKTKHNKDYLRDYKLPAHEVALSSASAPVYFPPHSYSYDNEFGNGVVINMIDGGIFANNPTLIGILEATDKLNIPLSDLKIISVGTGKGKHIVKKRCRSHNFWYWFIPKPRLLEIILDSQAQITEQYVAFIQRMNAKEENQFGYVRVQYEFGEDIIDLNASSKKDIDRLEAIGDELAKKHLSTIISLLTPQI